MQFGDAIYSSYLISHPLLAAPDLHQNLDLIILVINQTFEPLLFHPL